MGKKCFWNSLLTIAILTSFLLIFSSCQQAASENSYDKSYDDGYDDGYTFGEYEGYNEGYEEGYNEGYEEGYNEGYDEGHNEGYPGGYNDGYNDGYYAGATYTCLFFDDIDRAFNSAKKGAAWYTFIDAYDQYICNIFDDDETRSSLHWAIVSAVHSENITEEEKQLLISTFGEDLFIRNGVLLSP